MFGEKKGVGAREGCEKSKERREGYKEISGRGNEN